MLADMINTIVALAHQTADFKRTQLPGNRVQVRAPDGTVEVYDNDPPQLIQRAYNYEALCDWARDYGEAHSLRFYVGESGISATVDEAHDPHAHYCSMLYEKTAAWHELMGWIRNPLSPTLVVRLLRGYLWGTYSDSLLPIFRRIEFKRSSTGGKVISHVGDSLGRSVEQEAKAADGEIPESITFSLVPYRALPLENVNIPCAVEVDPDSETIRLIPQGDCIEQAILASKMQIVAALKSEFSDSLVIHAEDSVDN